MDFICTLTNVASLRTCLAELPSTYEKAYEITFERILKQPDSIVNLAKRVLNWVLQAKRPLTMLELQHAIVINNLNSKSIDPEILESSKIILASCLGMVSLSKTDGRVSIVHATARQFLLTNEQELSGSPQLDVARSCLKYLAFDEFSTGSCDSVASLRQRLVRMPFLDYCAHAWGNHIRQFQGALWDDLLIVLCSPPLCANVWQVVHYQDLEDSEACEVVFSTQPRNPHGLHVAAFWGFAGFIMRASKINYGLVIEDFSPVDSHSWTPLHWAASMGNKETVKSLLNQGVDINVSDANDWTPLTFAIVKGHYDVVKFLLSRGADRKTPNGLNFPSGEWAHVCSHEDILQLLRDTMDKSNTGDEKIQPLPKPEEETWKVSIQNLENSMDPLELDNALKKCEEPMEELGLYQFAHKRPSFIKSDTTTPELWGTLVKMDNYHWLSDTPKVGISTSLRKQILELAILQEKLSIVRLVVLNDARIRKEIPRGIVGGGMRTFLHTAAYGTNASIVAFLIQAGADGGVHDGLDRSPLHLAAAYGSFEVVQAMLEAPNLNVDAKEMLGRTAIQWCCALGGWRYRANRSKENIQICQLLLSKGASLSITDDGGHSALHYAIVLRDEEVIKLFLNSGLRLDQRNKKGESPLDTFTNDTYYGYLSGGYGHKCDRPCRNDKYYWEPSQEQTMAALRSVEPYIGSDMEMTPQVKELLREAMEGPPAYKLPGADE